MSFHINAALSVADQLSKAAVETPSRLFARFEGEPLPLAELDQTSAALASWMSNNGVVPGERVAVMLHNSLDAIITIFAIAKTGAVWVPVNPQQRGSNLAYVIDHASPVMAIVEEELEETLRSCGSARMPALLKREHSSRSGLGAALRSDTTGNEFRPEAEDTFALMFTSGTTGPPKGVIVTNRMMSIAAEGALVTSDGGDNSNYFLWEPLYHIGGAQMLLLPLMRECELSLVGRFSASQFWNQARQTGATHVHYLGGILEMLLKQAPAEIDSSHGVLVAWGGGCRAETFEAVRDRFGVEVRECYGMTEGSSIATAGDGTKGGVVGQPLPWFEVSIQDENGKILAAGQRGQIVLRSLVDGAIFSGYYQNPTATEQALREGALLTGDQGSLDEDGVLTFHGRLTESLRCRGENVSAWEVEHVLDAYEGVEESAVIGVPAEIGEQDIKVFIQPSEGSNIDPVKLWEWLGSRLAKHQIPRYVVFVDDFERTPSQRIKKHLLSRSTRDAWDRESGHMQG